MLFSIICTPPRCHQVVCYCKECPEKPIFSTRTTWTASGPGTRTPSVDVTVTVIVISWQLFSYPFVYISVLCINLCSSMSYMAFICCACMCVVCASIQACVCS